MARFDALVQDPGRALDRILSDIGMEKAQSLEGALDGWQANTSFNPLRGVSDEVIGRHKEHLPDMTRAFIEATCLPEMRALEIPVEMSSNDAIRAIKAGPGKETIHRPGRSHYAFSDLRKDEEVRRFNSLIDPAQRYDPAIHITPAAHAELRNALRN